MSNEISRIDNFTILTDANVFDRLTALSHVMANSGEFVPAHFRGKPDACMAVAMQAARWGLDPIAVAQKTHIVQGTMGYEAQLVNAVINTMAPTKDRLNYEWFGEWEKILGKVEERTGQNNKKYFAPGWNRAAENGLGVKVWATMKGEDNPRVLVLMLTQAQVRNSTLWASDPRQQLAYLACKRWARLHCPEVILGVYTRDELEQPTERVINPERKATVDDFQHASSAGSTNAPGAPEKPLEGELVSDEPTLWDKLRGEIESVKNVDDARTVGEKVKSLKDKLPVSEFNGLHALASSRYRYFLHKGNVDTAINSIGESGTDEGLASFQFAQKTLSAARRHIGDEEYQAYSITLADIATEYQ